MATESPKVSYPERRVSQGMSPEYVGMLGLTRCCGILKLALSAPLTSKSVLPNLRTNRVGQSVTEAAPGECILLHRENGSSPRGGEPCAEAVNRPCGPSPRA